MQDMKALSLLGKFAIRNRQTLDSTPQPKSTRIWSPPESSILPRLPVLPCRTQPPSGFDAHDGSACLGDSRSRKSCHWAGWWRTIDVL